MIQKRSKNRKAQHLKTQANSETQITLMEFGKPVKLPNIHKKGNRYQNNPMNSRSIEARNSTGHNKTLTGKSEQKNISEQINLRKYSNNSQLHLLTLQEMQLCSQRSKKFLPKISGLANCFVSTRQNNEYFDREEFMRKLGRMKSQKKIEAGSNDQLYNYKLDAVIGRGSYSIVRLAYNLNGKKFAVKVYYKSKLTNPDRHKNLQRQIKILKQLKHENIINFKESIQTDDSIYLVMELFNNCSLGDFLKKNVDNDNLSIILEQEPINKIIEQKKSNHKMGNKKKHKISEIKAKNIFKQTIEAISYLHTKNIVHRDIKLDNILIQAKQMKIKVIDFGFSCFDDGNIVHEDYCGTPNYISPEILKKNGYKGKPADIWALGILLFYLVAGYYPFKCPSQYNEYEKINYRQQLKISKQLSDLLSKMLKKNPQSRLTIQQVLQSQWIIKQKK